MSKIGVLALQGDVREHECALESLGATPVAVKHADQLAGVDALILPGGESTTIGKLLDRFGMLQALKDRVREGMPLYGTCAGLILMATGAVGDHGAPHRLGVLDVTVRRNGYGRQADSFETDIDITGIDHPVRAVFIRAPVIEAVGEDVEVLARVDSDPVLVRQGNLLASSFHPEISGDSTVHSLFLRMVEG